MNEEQRKEFEQFQESAGFHSVRVAREFYLMKLAYNAAVKKCAETVVTNNPASSLVAQKILKLLIP